jgi:hypothetical protein
VASVPLDGGKPLEVVLVTASGGRPTRRSTAVAALCAEVLHRRGAASVTPV